VTIQCDLSGKLALITGASSGLGEHFARTLAAQGASVVLAARRLEKLNALKEDIENNGGKAFAVKMDVTSLSSVEAAFAAIQSEFNRPCDTLINNSGVAQSSWFMDTDEEEWKTVIDTNLSGAWRVAKHAAKAMIADQQPGSIVNIASITGLRSSPMIAGYAASKAAVIHLTQNMALELARYQIRVNSISPGYFTTPINEDYLNLLGKVATSEQKERFLDKLVSGEHRSAFFMTEPPLEGGAGSDPSMLKTTAVQDGNHWVINGRKTYITGAEGANVGIVMAMAEEGASLFLVDLPHEAIKLERVLDTIDSSMPGGHAEITIDNLRLPADQMLGNPGDGFRLARHGRLRRYNAAGPLRPSRRPSLGRPRQGGSPV